MAQASAETNVQAASDEQDDFGPQLIKGLEVCLFIIIYIRQPIVRLEK